MGDLAMLPAVYLDFNVLVFVLDGLQPALRSELESARDAGRIHVPFSIEHIVEVTRGYDELAESVRLRVDRMVRDMGELSRSRFVTLDQHTGALRIEARNPAEVWETAFVRLSDFGVDDPEVERALHEALRGGAQAVEMHRALLSRIALDGIPTADLAAGLEDLFKVGRSFFLDARDLQERLDEALARARPMLEARGFTPAQLNNFGPGELIAALDHRLEQAESPTDFAGLRARARQDGPGGGIHVEAAHAAMLAGLGYRRDPARVFAASRVSDGVHLAFGLKCALFITDDGRLRDRARATALQCELPVVVASLDEALEAVRRCAYGT